MQFRWNFYEYSRGKLRPLLPGAKWTRTDFSDKQPQLFLSLPRLMILLKWSVPPPPPPPPPPWMKPYQVLWFSSNEVSPPPGWNPARSYDSPQMKCPPLLDETLPGLMILLKWSVPPSWMKPCQVLWFSSNEVSPPPPRMKFSQVLWFSSNEVSPPPRMKPSQVLWFSSNEVSPPHPGWNSARSYDSPQMKCPPPGWNPARSYDSPQMKCPPPTPSGWNPARSYDSPQMKCPPWMSDRLVSTSLTTFSESDQGWLASLWLWDNIPSMILLSKLAVFLSHTSFHLLQLHWQLRSVKAENVVEALQLFTSLCTPSFFFAKNQPDCGR